jgi:hypothetical protein
LEEEVKIKNLHVVGAQMRAGTVESTIVPFTIIGANQPHQVISDTHQ